MLEVLSLWPLRQALVRTGSVEGDARIRLALATPPSLTFATAPFNLCPCERQTLVQAETDWVFIDAKTGQALAIPDAIKSAFQVVAIGEESWLQSHD